MGEHATTMLTMLTMLILLLFVMCIVKFYYTIRQISRDHSAKTNEKEEEEADHWHYYQFEIFFHVSVCCVDFFLLMVTANYRKIAHWMWLSTAHYLICGFSAKIKFATVNIFASFYEHRWIHTRKKERHTRSSNAFLWFFFLFTWISTSVRLSFLLVAYLFL